MIDLYYLLLKLLIYYNVFQINYKNVITDGTEVVPVFKKSCYKSSGNISQYNKKL